MKKIFLVICTSFLISSGLCAQTNDNNQFLAEMQTNLQQLDTVSAGPALLLLANNFERMATAEKTRWEPYYYATYCYTQFALNTTDYSKIDELADKAAGLLARADQLQPKNSEISVLFAMIKSAKILVDPMSRWMDLSQEVENHISQAKIQDPANPRPYLLEARIKYRTPEDLGGSTEMAKKLLAESIKKFDSFKPASPIAPNWGLKGAIIFMEKLNNP